MRSLIFHRVFLAFLLLLCSPMLFAALVSAPDIFPDSRTFYSHVAVMLDTPDGNTRVFYTLDGSQPTEHSLLYEEPILLTKDATLRSIAVSASGSRSEEATASFTVLESPVWTPAPTTLWQWQLQGEIDTSFDVAMYDIDLFDTPQATIDELHAAGRTVICYFSAGSWEDWRADSAAFPASVKGRKLGGWPGEKWLDIRDLETLAPIMRARLDLATAKNCDGVEPDNIDAYSNRSGFDLTAEDQLRYNLWLSNEANARGLSIGLKNDLDQVRQLQPYFDWALNEQCYEYDECDSLMPFITNGKAVFGIEYELAMEAFCDDALSRQFSWIVKSYDLDAATEFCVADGEAFSSITLEANRWYLLSLPATPLASHTLASLFGDDLPMADYGWSWVIYRYSADDSYQLVNDVTQLNSGTGFWIHQQTGASVTLDVPVNSQTATGLATTGCAGERCFGLPVAQRSGASWSLLGHPFDHYSLFDNLRITTSDGDCNPSCTLDQSEAAGYVHNGLWYYAANGAYQQHLPGSALSPWEGFWAASWGRDIPAELNLLVPEP